MFLEAGCVVVGVVLGGAAALTAYLIQQRAWPVKLQNAIYEAELRVKQETFRQSAGTVQPVVDQVVSQIQEVVTIVEEAVLELIVCFQDITDVAIQKANQTAAELGHTEDGQSGDHSLLDETNRIIGSFAQSVVESSQLGIDRAMVVEEVEGSTQRIPPPVGRN